MRDDTASLSSRPRDSRVPQRGRCTARRKRGNVGLPCSEQWRTRAPGTSQVITGSWTPHDRDIKCSTVVDIYTPTHACARARAHILTHTADRSEGRRSKRRLFTTSDDIRAAYAIRLTNVRIMTSRRCRYRDPRLDRRCLRGNFRHPHAEWGEGVSRAIGWSMGRAS